MSKGDLIKKAFSEINCPLNDEEILSTCTMLCSRYSLTPEALAQKWDARYAVNNKLDTITMGEIEKWKLDINKQLQFQKKRAASSEQKYVRLSDIDVTSFGVDDTVPKEPKKRKIAINRDEDVLSHKIDNAALFKSRRFQPQYDDDFTPATPDDEPSAHRAINGNATCLNEHGANGNANGHANGHANGYANGHENGKNGAANGNVTATNESDKFSDDTYTSQDAFSQRSNPGKVELRVDATAIIGDEATFEIWEDIEKSVKIQIESNYNIVPYRFMGEEIEQRASVLEDRLVELGMTTMQDNVLPLPQMFHIPAQEPVTGMGRICADAEAPFSESAVVLEADQDHAKARVLLDFRTVEKFSVFPGQIVIAEGVNTTGRSLTVNDLFEPKPLPLYKTPYIPPRTYPYAPLTMLIAAGPFTTSDNLSYRPLEQLLDVVERTNPQVVILVGPFVDTSQEQVQKSDLSFVQLFQSNISEVLKRALDRITKNSLPASKVLLVPHPRDPDVQPLPQPPFFVEEYKLDSKWITPVSNPSTMRINDFSVGVTSVDVIRHLASQEVSRGMPADRISRLCTHLLKQKSFYPVFPPAQEVSIEFTKLQNLDLSYAPNFLVVPSDLQFFVKNVSDTIFINPGRLSRAKTGGTYAKVTVFPAYKANGDVDMQYENDTNEPNETTKEQPSVSSRTRVEIVRI